MRSHLSLKKGAENARVRADAMPDREQRAVVELPSNVTLLDPRQIR
jgi:hypothetical protein